ncbi:prepilin peptidase [Paenibacillus sp. IB182496]|uniref:Prepilin peptidase n=1 Tax=Paenibacillus sabuli TaxID=2772509 RepID=A0A927GQI7_9BACL|nr:A24 family peptidase [Paenibacillus sabuli]MBD2844321.1 prepilin peptidase [Paenibacillus sabuli]
MVYSHYAAAALLAVALWCDIRAMTIPNKLTVPAVLAAWAFGLLWSGLGGLGAALAGTAAGLTPMLLLYLLKGIGAGDVKLFAALGGWIGAFLVWQVMIYSILLAGGIGVLVLLFNRPFGRRVAALLQRMLPDMLLIGWAAARQRLTKAGNNGGADGNGTVDTVAAALATDDSDGEAAQAGQRLRFPFMLAVAPGAVLAWMML